MRRSRFNDSGSRSCEFIQSSAARSSRTTGSDREFRRVVDKTGLQSYPDATTLRRFLVRVEPSALGKPRALHDRLLKPHDAAPWATLARDRRRNRSV